MFTKIIKYKDFNNVDREETFYFDLSEAELVDMEMGTTGGLSEKLKKVVETKDNSAIVKFFKELILKAYGEKSADGKRFIKSEELSTAFSQTRAFSNMYIEMLKNEEKASEFVNALIVQPDEA